MRAPRALCGIVDDASGEFFARKCEFSCASLVDTAVRASSIMFLKKTIQLVSYILVTE